MTCEELEKRTKKQIYFYWMSIFFTIILSYIIIFQVTQNEEMNTTMNTPVSYLFKIGIILTSIGILINYFMFKSIQLCSKLPDIIIDRKVYDNLDIKDQPYYTLLSKCVLFYLFFVIILINIGAMFGCMVGITHRNISKAHPFMIIAFIAAILVKPKFDKFIAMVKENKL